MFRGIYTAANGMTTLQNRMDAVSNNMANVNTTGYKRDVAIETNEPNFPNILASVRGMGATQEPTTFQGRGVTATSRDGELTIVNDAGEIGIDYSGQLYLTKSGIFRADSEGYLATKEGHRLLGKNGPIQTNGQAVEVDKAGNVKVGGQTVDTLYRVNPRNSVGIIDSEILRMNMFTKHDQGGMNSTGGTLDAGIEGKGFFTVNTANGPVYTRAGNFVRSSEGYLVNQGGNRVQGENGDIPISGVGIKIASDGTISEAGQVIDKLKITDFTDYRYLEKVTGDTFKVKPDFAAEATTTPFTGNVLQGVLEGSNVNSVTEMVDMLVVNRNYESSQKVIQAYDLIMGKAANDIGSLR